MGIAETAKINRIIEIISDMELDTLDEPTLVNYQRLLTAFFESAYYQGKKAAMDSIFERY